MEGLENKIEELLDDKINWEVFSDNFPDTASIIEEAMRNIAVYYFNKGKKESKI